VVFVFPMMGAALASLAIALQAELLVLEFLGHRTGAHPKTLPPQLGRQLVRTPVGPAQRTLRIASNGRLDQAFQRRGQTRLLVDRPLTTAARPANATWRQAFAASGRRFQFLKALVDGRRRHARRRHHGGNAPTPQRSRFRRRPQTPRLLMQRPTQRLILLPQPIHNHGIRHTSTIGKQGTKRLHYFCAKP
jgi:hypothetical protein